MFRRWWWIFLIMIVIGPLLGLMISAVVTYVMPKKYESTAVVQVNRMVNRIIMNQGGAGPAGGRQPTSQFFGTEFEVIKARKTLQMVIGNLDLTRRWGVDNEEAMTQLKSMIDTQNIRGTELIRIRVRSTNAEDARDIAMETAKAYRDRRAALERDLAKEAIEKLDKALREQEDRVDESGKVLEEMRMKLRVAKIQLELPRSPILIHEEPVLARRPCSPNVTLNLVLGLVAGLPLGLLLALPLMWIAERLAGPKRKPA